MPSRLLDVLSATRLHFPSGTTALPQATVQHLKDYARMTESLGIASAVAVNCLEGEVRRIIEEAAPGLALTVLHVPVWGAFVPALNTLLGEAQRQGRKYVLYQSLEVLCPAPVLRQLLDHFTPDTLVVGPVLDGHSFEPGEQPLNGRTTPWNTLALWSMRKLGLTGFLSIADGMPKAAQQFTRQISGDDPTSAMVAHRQESAGSVFDPDLDEHTVEAVETSAMGSAGWWEAAPFAPAGPASNTRQFSDFQEIPAGVEEVTAIALLQHLLRDYHARAILILLPPELRGLVSWSTNWGGDERRRQWHDYKMASKVSRPAAQIRQLFRKTFRQRLQAGLQAPLLQCLTAEQKEPQLNFGTVLHFESSICPVPQVESICLFSVALFSANFAYPFAAAFGAYNDARAFVDHASIESLTFIALLIGGVYLPMPISLWITRFSAARGGHIAGFALFAALLLAAHSALVLREAAGRSNGAQRNFVIGTRLLQGLASGVLFQSRFVLASLSTQDQHQRIQASLLLASDVGLGLGALLPWAACSLWGETELPKDSPELGSSVVLAVLSLLLLVWILVAFPWHLHRLPDRVRFRASVAQAPGDAAERTSPPCSPDAERWRRFSSASGPLRAPPVHSADPALRRWRARLIASGTARAFAQSAAMMALALGMRDGGVTGEFRQTKAIAALSLVPAPFEALASGIGMPEWLPRPGDHGRRVAIATVAAVAALHLGASLIGGGAAGAETVVLIGIELIALMVALAIAAPLNASKLFGQKNAEGDMVLLEWLKAYIGRLLGPVIAIVVHDWLGYWAQLTMLCVVTVSIALTA